MRITALILCLLIFPLAALSQTGSTQTSNTISVEDNAETDAAMATRIREILRALPGFDQVRVAVNSGIVTLTGTTLDTASATRLTELVGRVEGVVAIENEVLETTDVVDRLNPAMERFRARATQVLTFLPLAVVALGVFAVIVLLGFYLAGRKEPWARLSPNAFIADIYRQILRLLFVIAGLVVALDIVGATALLSGILGAAGIAGLAIGFAVRDTVENFIASIMLSIRQPFRPNDTVEIEGDIGKVIRLTSRATILLSLDGNHIRIPNATVFKSRIINYTRNCERRFTFALTVAPEAELDMARRLAEDTMNALPFVLETPACSAWVESVDDCWVTLTMAGWIDQTRTDYNLARSEAIRLTQAAFVEADIAAPLPTYRIEGLPAAEAPQKSTRAPKLETPAPVQAVASTVDKALERIVEQERAELSRLDLLHEDARQE